MNIPSPTTTSFLLASGRREGVAAVSIVIVQRLELDAGGGVNLHWAPITWSFHHCRNIKGISSAPSGEC